ncbi:hypothetical protein [Paraburkholderia sediminicola]|uniref:hypothetical protein n=1 Tax=Paraburkholderia sediminicola TaxID=458836 RepID=UPI0038B7C446
MAQREMPEAQVQAAARAEFDRIFVGARILVMRRREILAGMVAEGATQAQSEQQFAAQLSDLLTKARHYAAVAGMPEAEQKDQLSRFDDAFESRPRDLH